MSDVNYMNPGSIKPEYDYKPNGILGGMAYAQDRNRYENMAGLQDMMMMDAARLSRENVEQGMPVRQAERAAALKDLPMKSRQLGAQTDTLEQSAAFTRATQPGAIDTTNQGNAAKAGDMRMQQMEQSIAAAQALSQLGDLGPDIIPRLGQMGLDMNNPIVREILNTNDPRQIGPRAQKALQALSQARASYRQATDLQGMQNKGAFERTTEAGKWSVEAAKSRAANRAKNLWQQFQIAASKMNVDQMQFVGEMILADEEIMSRPDAQAIRTQIQAGIDQARRSAASRDSRNSVTLPGFPAPGAGIPAVGAQLGPKVPTAPTHRFNPQTGKIEPIQ